MTYFWQTVGGVALFLAVAVGCYWLLAKSAADDPERDREAGER